MSMNQAKYIPTARNNGNSRVQNELNFEEYNTLIPGLDSYDHNLKTGWVRTRLNPEKLFLSHELIDLNPSMDQMATGKSVYRRYTHYTNGGNKSTDTMVKISLSDTILNEIRMLKKVWSFHKENIVPFIASYSSTDPIMHSILVTKTIPNSTLAYFIKLWRKKDRITMPFRMRYMSAIGLVGAVAALHEHGIVHQAIEPDNILVDEKGNLYLSSFDQAIENVNEVWVPAINVKQEIVHPYQHEVTQVGMLMYWLFAGRSPGKTGVMKEFSKLRKMIELAGTLNREVKMEQYQNLKDEDIPYWKVVEIVIWNFISGNITSEDSARKLCANALNDLNQSHEKFPKYLLRPVLADLNFNHYG